jgi:hypothetical protein
LSKLADKETRQASDSTAARSDAIPPLKLMYQGDEYHLQQSVNVRQSQETVNLKTGSDYDSIMDSKSITITDLPIIKESRKDSESELATSACQVGFGLLRAMASAESLLFRRSCATILPHRKAGRRSSGDAISSALSSTLPPGPLWRLCLTTRSRDRPAPPRLSFERSCILAYNPPLRFSP